MHVGEWTVVDGGKADGPVEISTLKKLFSRNAEPGLKSETTVDFSNLTDNARALLEASTGRTNCQQAVNVLKQFREADVITAETSDGKVIGVFYGDDRVIETIATTRAKRPKVMKIYINESADYEDIECLTMLCETIKGSCCFP